MENKAKYLDKIKKLLNLARRTSNPAEAASALSKAQAMMAKHGVSDSDVELMDIGESSSKGAPSDAQKIPKYMAMLGHVICSAFGVLFYFSFNANGKRVAVFYGPTPRPEIAAYAFDVMSRQLHKARREYQGGLHRNTKATNKAAKGDVFCEWWVNGAYQVITQFAVSEAEQTLMEAYHHRLMGRDGMATDQGRAARKCSGRDGAAAAGFTAGRRAELNHGVGGAAGANSEPLKIGETL
ncbi:DUF2786 domain-containing protein [Serratia fonticola]|uniref:DUF2786 domain-containing protein n=3 Tax=Serratia fonticola TaxID=47917 RepID=UPI00301DE2D4